MKLQVETLCMLYAALYTQIFCNHTQFVIQNIILTSYFIHIIFISTYLSMSVNTFAIKNTSNKSEKDIQQIFYLVVLIF